MDQPAQYVDPFHQRLCGRRLDQRQPGPVYSADDDRAPLLRGCYTTSLAVAAGLGTRSVAYPLISSGVNRWPKDDAVTQALAGLHPEPTTVELVRLVLFGEPTRHATDNTYQASSYCR